MNLEILHLLFPGIMDTFGKTNQNKKSTIMKQHYLLKSAIAFAMLLGVGNVQAQKTGFVPNEVSDLLVSMFDVSPNGKYSCGFQTMQCYSASYDMEADTSFIYSKYSDETPIFNMVWAVSDDGTVVGHYGEDWGGELTRVFYSRGSEDWTILDAPEGCKPNGSARCIAADNSVIGGFVPLANVNTEILAPVIWKNESGKYMPYKLPYPELDFFGLETMRAMVEQMSDDGSVLVGRMTDSSGMGNVILVWTRDEQSGEYSYKVYGEDYTYNKDAEKPGPYPEESDYIHSEPGTPEYEAEIAEYAEIVNDWIIKRNACYNTKMLDELSIFVSGNGRYLTCSYKCPSGDQYPFYIDLQTGETVEITEAGNAAPRGITNSGMLVYVSPAVGFARQTYVCTSNEDIQKVQDWYKSEFDLDLDSFLAENSLSVSGTAAMSSDASVMTFYQPDPAREGYGLDYFVKVSIDGAVISTADNNISAFVDGNTLHISEEGCGVEVVDMAGNIVLKAADSASSVDLSGVANGLYIIKINKGSNKMVLKTIVG